MIKLVWFANGFAAACVLAMASCLVGSSAYAAAGCDTPDAYEAKVRAASTCERAHAALQTCAFGSTADLQPAAIVTEKCEAKFIGKVGASRVAAYRTKLAACDRKYGHGEGTLARSENAMCRADTAYQAARRYKR